MRTDRLPETGIYRLPVAVSNPNYDRRTRHDWTRDAGIPAGLYFLRKHTHPTLRDSVRIEKITERGRAIGYVTYAGLEHPILEVMLPTLEIEEKPNAVGMAIMESLENSPFEILQALLDVGFIHPIQFKQACEKLNAKYDEENK